MPTVMRLVVCVVVWQAASSNVAPRIIRVIFICPRSNIVISRNRSAYFFGLPLISTGNAEERSAFFGGSLSQNRCSPEGRKAIFRAGAAAQVARSCPRRDEARTFEHLPHVASSTNCKTSEEYTPTKARTPPSGISQRAAASYNPPNRPISYLEGGSEDQLLGGTEKSRRRAIAAKRKRNDLGL
jgi:hypothetical protein